MHPMMQPAVGSTQESRDIQLPPSMRDNANSSALPAHRARSDSLDIFTMSPLGTPPLDSYPDTHDVASPHLRLPDPPALDLDLDVSKPHHRAMETHPCSASPPSTPNSPTSFSFSPPLRARYQHRYSDASYPLEAQYGSVSGGTSYGTGMTSLVGSWGTRDGDDAYNEVATAQEDKGKSPQHESHGSLDDLDPVTLDSTALESAIEKGKGKGKAVEIEIEVDRDQPSPPHTPFEFDFDFHQGHQFDLGLRTSHSDVDEDEAAELPIVRLSPGSRYRQFGPSVDSAGPSSRNGEVAVICLDDDPEEPASRPDSVQRPFPHVSPLSSPPPQSPFLPPAALPPRLTGESPLPTSPLRAPTHRRSFSSLSLRSIRSSSSRSIASIRSTGIGIRGKVRSMAPAAKKLKGGLRKMFRRAGSPTVASGAKSVSSDDEADTGDEGPPREPRHAFEVNSNPHEWEQAPQEQSDSHPPRLSLDSHEQGHTHDASADSQATVTVIAASGILCVPEVVEEVRPMLGIKPRTMSEPLPFTGSMGVPEVGPKNEDNPEMDREQCIQVNVEVHVVEAPAPPNHFNDTLPRELQLAVLRTLVDMHEVEHARAERGEGQHPMWSVRAARRSRWVGRDKGVRELVKLTRVSKAWQSLAFDGQLWDALHLISVPPHLSPALLLRLAEHAGSFVRSLDLQGWTHLDPVTLRALVRSFSLAATADASPSSPLAILLTSPPRFPPTNLTHVSLRTCTSLTAHSLHHVLLRAPHLRSVNLRGMSAVTNTTCGVLAAYCPRLEVADLGRCGNMDGDGLRELVGGGGLARSWTSEESNPSILRGETKADTSEQPNSKLRVLRASGLKRVDEEVLAALGRGAPHLEVLDLSGSRDLTDEAIEAFVEWDDAWDVLSSCHRRIELSARELGRDPTADFGPFFKRITRLRHLSLSSCALLTDTACTHLAHCVPALEFLELAGIGSELKEDGLVRLLSTTPLIRRLDLEDASDLTDAVLDALTPSVSVEVRRRGVLVPPLPQPGHALEHLVLSYALSVTNDALLALIRGCERLKVLECDNTRISGAILKEFVKLARHRRMRGAEVVAVDCRAITETLVKDLAESGQTRARKGYRHYEARKLGYVDARDDENLGAAGILGGIDVDDCDEARVALKSFWSWQAVDAIRQAREKRRKTAPGPRRNTDAGVLREAFRRSGMFGEDDEELFGEDGAGPSSRARWLTHWTRASGFGSSSPTGMPVTNEEDRGCIMM